jgi:hypothetical protein
VVEDPGRDHRVVAGQQCGHVLGRLPAVDVDLVGLEVIGWPPSCTTAISVELRVRFDGFSKISAAPARRAPAAGRRVRTAIQDLG